MGNFGKIAAVLFCVIPAASLAAEAPQYTPENRLNVPKKYREWVFVTSSIDLNYERRIAGQPHNSTLDNVFVNPEAYKVFVATGTWPDKTVLVKENRMAVSAGSISKSGKFQTQVTSIEFHVKDQARFQGGWAFFASDGKTPGIFLAPSARCYSCHQAHGAVDTTFVQFYPTLMDIAKAKHVLSKQFLRGRTKSAN